MTKAEYEAWVIKRTEELYNKLKENHIPVAENIVSIKVNSRAKKRLGSCKKMEINGKEAFLIDISLITCSLPEREREKVILHELLHTCPGCMNHQKKWKQFAGIVQEKFGYEITTTSNYDKLGLKEHDEEELYRYRITCKKCGNSFYRFRAGKVVQYPNLYRCSACGGKLVVEFLRKKA